MGYREREVDYKKTMSAFDTVRKKLFKNATDVSLCEKYECKNCPQGGGRNICTNDKTRR